MTGLRIHVIKEGRWPTLELAECAARVCESHRIRSRRVLRARQRLRLAETGRRQAVRPRRGPLRRAWAEGGLNRWNARWKRWTRAAT